MSDISKINIENKEYFFKDAEGRARIEEAAETAKTALDIAQGNTRSKVFETTSAMYTWLADAANKGVLKTGDSLYVKELDVPDWWVTEALDAPNADGRYYNIAPLEAEGAGSGGGSDINVIDNLTTADSNAALSANQGKVLNEKINNMEMQSVIAEYEEETATLDLDFNVPVQGIIEDTLESTNAFNALSANQGRILNEKLENYVDVKNLQPYYTQDYNANVDVPIEFDGYICERVNFTSTAGYSFFSIKNEKKEKIFSHQLSCGKEVSYSYDGNFLPVKKGWYFCVEGENVERIQIKFANSLQSDSVMTPSINNLTVSECEDFVTSVKTGTNIKAHKCGNIISLRLYIEANVAQKETYVTIGNLTKYKPVETIRTPLAGAGNIDVGTCYIDADDGTIQVYVSSTTSYYGAHIMYLTEDGVDNGDNSQSGSSDSTPSINNSKWKAISGGDGIVVEYNDMLVRVYLDLRNCNISAGQSNTTSYSLPSNVVPTMDKHIQPLVLTTSWEPLDAKVYICLMGGTNKIQIRSDTTLSNSVLLVEKIYPRHFFNIT